MHRHTVRMNSYACPFTYRHTHIHTHARTYWHMHIHEIPEQSSYTLIDDWWVFHVSCRLMLLYTHTCREAQGRVCHQSRHAEFGTTAEKGDDYTSAFHHTRSSCLSVACATCVPTLQISLCAGMHARAHARHISKAACKVWHVVTPSSCSCYFIRNQIGRTCSCTHGHLRGQRAC